MVTEGQGAGGQSTGLIRAGFVVLDTRVTPELAQEGLARDVIRLVQQARRDAGLDITDGIGLTLYGDDPVRQAALAHQQLILGETLAEQFDCPVGPGVIGPGVTGTVGEDQTVRVVVRRTA